MNGPAFKMGERSKVKYNENPGPGSYDAAFDPMKPRPMTSKIGTSSRKPIVDKKTVEIPGPG